MRRVILFFLLSSFCVLIPLKADYIAVEPGQIPKELDIQEPLLPEGELLSAEEATRLALADHLGIRIARLESRIEHEAQGIARSIYDMNVDIEATYSHDREEQVSLVLGSREVEGVVQTSLEKKIPTGTVLGVSVGTRRNSTTSDFSTLSRNYQSFLTFSVEQPLLKNFFGLVDRAKIEKVVINTQKFNYAKLDEVEALVLEVRRIYWNLVYAFHNVEARHKALRRAQEFWAITTDQLDVGLTEKPDVYAAQANVRRRLIDLKRAATEFRNFSYELKTKLNRSEVKLVFPEASLTFERSEVNQEQILKQALETRWDLLQARLNLESGKIDLKIARNEMLPELTFEADVSSTSLDREMASSQGEVFSWNHPQYFAGVTFHSPVERREERGKLNQSRWALTKAEKMLEQVRQNIDREVRESIRSLELAVYEVEQTREVEKLERSKLEEEDKNFRIGRSDSKTLIDFQDDVIDAEVAALRALADYQIVKDQFYRSQNHLLHVLGVTKDRAMKGPEAGAVPS